MKNHGVIAGPLGADWRAGAIAYKIVNPEGNWIPKVVVGEHQSWGQFESMACVSFAVDNVVEIQIKDQTGIEVNHSDRFLAKMSGTTPQGNYVSTVLKARRDFRNVREPVWPTPANPNWNSYYAEIPQVIKDLAKITEPFFDLQWEYVGNTKDAIAYHLKHAPLLITIPGHEVTGLKIEGDELVILDDYLFNIYPNMPFLRKIKISDITDIYKAVVTVRKEPMRLVNDNGTVYIVGEKGKIGLADEGLYKSLKEITTEETGSTAGIPQSKVIESVDAFQIKQN